MNDELKTFGLVCCQVGAPSPVLVGVSAVGRLDGVLFDLRLRQTYRNDSRQTLELVYTFPLPHQAVLMRFASELNGARQVGRVVAKRQAEARYEQGLADGDAPVMLEALDGGLHTANIGNLKPGDALVLEVRYAQLLAFEHGRIRLAIPTTIAPRFGNPLAAGLQPQQVPEASLLADYPLDLSVSLCGALSAASVECPTHRVVHDTVDGCRRLRLSAGARLDRDVVLLVQPCEPMPSLVVQGRDAVVGAAPVVVMAAFQPPAAAVRARVALKLLVDCSGSMAGDSIASARAALKGVLAGLRKTDHVSLSRFGSTVDHVAALRPCTGEALARLGSAVDAMAADLGGTEMEDALEAVFALPAPRDAGAADVLLITDGDIWQAQAMIDAARAGGHRVFAIGVGTSPAEGVLRSLAEATGGACEFATPGEALEGAARRMLSRICQSPWRKPRVVWGSGGAGGAAPAWQTALPLGVFGADTVLAFAGMQAGAKVTAVRLLATDEAGAEVEIARGSADAPASGDALSRVAASRRLAAADGPAALALAVAYQLMGDQSNCILLHERAAADKTTEVAELHRVASMLAAGWGGSGMVVQQGAAVLHEHAAACFDAAAAASRQPRPRRTAGVRMVVATPQPQTLERMAMAVVQHLSKGGQLAGLSAHCRQHALHPEAEQALEQAQALGASADAAWLLLAHWVNLRSKGVAGAEATAALQTPVRRLEARLVADCLALFDSLLGGYPNTAWTLSRAQRLQRAVTRAAP